MKVTQLPFPVRSRFLDPCLRAVRSGRVELESGNTLEVQLPPRGFNRDAIVTVESNQHVYFWINKETDPAWFSARIRAAALAIHQSGLSGRFEISHRSGLLKIRRVMEPSTQ